MPKVLTEGPYRFFFFSRENGEPPHVHVERDDAYAKLWLQPVRLARASGFAAHELNELIRIAQAHEPAFLESWHEHFGN
jgi:hypothetical protein